MTINEAVTICGQPDYGIEQLKGLATEMAGYYLKNFVVAFQGIWSASNIWMEGSQATDKKDYAYATIGRIVDFYATIPFDTQEGRVQFEPLIQVRSRLPELQVVAEETFEKRKSDAHQRLHAIILEITNIGKNHFNILWDILERIKVYPEQEVFRTNLLLSLNQNQV